MNLATRLIVAVAVALIATATITLIVTDRFLVRQAKEPLERQVDARLAWLRSCIEPSKGEIEWREESGRALLAPIWSMTTKNGRVLRQVGDVPGDSLRHDERMLIGAVDGAVADEQLLLDRGTEFIFSDPSKQLELCLSATVDAGPAQAFLTQQRWWLWTIGPAMFAALLALLASVIRWQVRPLERMVGRISAIGADDTSHRLGEVGGAAECQRLASTVDALLIRIAESRDRERAFSAAAAHELRTPLTQLGLALEVAARRERSPEETRQLLADLHTDVERLQTLTLGLLRLTTLTDVPVTAIPLAAVLTRYEGVSVEPIDPTLAVQADDVLLGVILGNLISNARRYGLGSTIEIGIISAADAVEIRVADRGPGILTADRERIFEPLVRLNAARSIGAQADGFGLGLTIARTLARRMGGELTCVARPDGQQGACFVLRLRRSAI
ncbi:MAG: HAMP domain-containing sensor histidine kinase [Planctomycetota bacterium]